MIYSDYNTDHIYDYYRGYDLNEVNNYPDYMIQEDFDKAYHILEVEEWVKSIEREREAKKLQKLYQIERIAKEAKAKEVSWSLIFKFFKAYSLNAGEQYIFWRSYQGLN